MILHIRITCNSLPCTIITWGLPLWFSWERIHLQCRRSGFNPWVGKISWRRESLPTPVFWPGEFHALYSPWGHKESDTTEWLSLHFTLLLLIHMTSLIHRNLKLFEHTHVKLMFSWHMMSNHMEYSQNIFEFFMSMKALKSGPKKD